MTASVNAYWLRLLDRERLGEIDFGRHILLNYPYISSGIQQRHYSIVGRRGDDLLEIAVKRQGDNGLAAQIHRTLTERSLLTAVGIDGCLTSQTLLEYRSVLMICGGMGITQPFSLVQGLAKLHEGGNAIPNVHLIVCAPTFDELVYFTQLLAMQARCDWLTVRVFVTRERVRAGITYLSQGRPSAEVLGHITTAPDATVLCGSNSFVTDWERQVREIFPSSAILDQHESKHLDGNRSSEVVGPSGRSSRLLLADRGVELDAPREQSLLVTLLSHGVELPNQCHIGICGRCSVRVLGGEVASTSDIGLSGREREAGYRLACCTKPRSETVTLDL